MTYEYAATPAERNLYELLFPYINRSQKLAFPEMDRHDLSLRLLSLQNFSTAAIHRTLSGILQCLERMNDSEMVEAAAEELREIRSIPAACDAVKEDSIVTAMRSSLYLAFVLMLQRGAARKAVIFTDSAVTQAILEKNLLWEYKIVL